MFAVLDDRLQRVSSDCNEAPRRIRIKKFRREKSAGHPIAADVNPNRLVSSDDVSYQSLGTTLHQKPTDVISWIIPQIVICSDIVSNLGAIVICPVVCQDCEESEVHKVVLHIELNNVVIFLIFLTNQPIIFFIILILEFLKFLLYKIIF